MPLFSTLTTERICSEIGSTQRHIILAAPGIGMPEADALLAAMPSADPRPPEQRHTPLPPFPWNPERRAQLRAELDAHYARLYGLTRDELRYILDPADVLGPDYPSETFRVLKNSEMREFGEYRTQKLVLAAWDAREN